MFVNSLHGIPVLNPHMLYTECFPLSFYPKIPEHADSMVRKELEETGNHITSRKTT